MLLHHFRSVIALLLYCEISGNPLRINRRLICVLLVSQRGCSRYMRFFFTNLWVFLVLFVMSGASKCGLNNGSDHEEEVTTPMYGATLVPNVRKQFDATTRYFRRCEEVMHTQLEGKLQGVQDALNVRLNENEQRIT